MYFKYKNKILLEQCIWNTNTQYKYCIWNTYFKYKYFKHSSKHWAFVPIPWQCRCTFLICMRHYHFTVCHQKFVDLWWLPWHIFSTPFGPLPRCVDRTTTAWYFLCPHLWATPQSGAFTHSSHDHHQHFQAVSSHEVTQVVINFCLVGRS